MRPQAACLAFLLVLAIPASTGSALLSDGPVTAPVLDPALLPPVATHDPQPHPAGWVAPLNRAPPRPGGEASGVPMAMPLSVGAEADLYLHPLDDVDGDRHADYLVETLLPEARVRLEAYRGIDHTRLWSLEQSQPYWFFLPDADGDGAREVVLVRQGAAQAENHYVPTPAGSVRAHTQRTPIHYDILRPGSGEVRATISAESTWTITGASAWAPNAGYASVNQWEHAYPSLQTSADGAGFDLDVGLWRDSDVLVNGPVAFLYGGVMTNTNRIHRYDADGQHQWTADLASTHGSYTYIVDRADYTGDGIADFLTSTVESGAYGYAWTPAISEGFDGPVEGTRVALYSGRDGSEVWSRMEPPMVNAYGGGLPGGRDADGHRTVLLHNLGSLAGGNGAEFGTRIRTLDGRTGDVLEDRTWLRKIVIATAFADIDSDGSDELWSATASPRDDPFNPWPDEDAFDLHAHRRDWSVVWTMRGQGVSIANTLDGGPAVADLDGDAVPEVLFVSYDGETGRSLLRVHSGATSRVLWNFLIDDRFAALFFVEDTDGDGGREVAFLASLPGVEGDLPNGHAATQTAYQSGAPLGNNMGAPDGELRGQHVELELRRGRDADLLWVRALDAPQVDGGVSATWSASVVPGGDVNGDGVPDLFVTFHGYCLDCPEEVEFLPGVAFILDGVEGRILRQIQTAGHSTPVPPPVPIKGLLPGLEVAALIAALGSLAVLRRRR
jgi:hypothetical protein